MDRLKVVAVGIDFSELSERVMREAIKIANANQAQLEVFHVIDEKVIGELKQFEHLSVDDVEHEAKRSLEEVLDKVTRVSDKPSQVNFHIMTGHPLKCIQREVEQVQADLFVAGMRGASTEDGPGVFATQCVRYLSTKVLLVSDTHEGPFKDMVVCVDFGDHTDAILEQGIRVAKMNQSRLHVLHVYFGPWHKLHYRAPTPEADPDFKLEYMKTLESHLNHLLDRYQEDVKDLDVVTKLYECSNHGDGVVNYLKEEGADLAILGTHNVNPLVRLFVGSTAERVLKQLPCSMLALKPES